MLAPNTKPRDKRRRAEPLTAVQLEARRKASLAWDEAYRVRQALGLTCYSVEAKTFELCELLIREQLLERKVKEDKEEIEKALEKYLTIKIDEALKGCSMNAQRPMTVGQKLYAHERAKQATEFAKMVLALLRYGTIEEVIAAADVAKKFKLDSGLGSIVDVFKNADFSSINLTDLLRKAASKSAKHGGRHCAA